MKSKIIIFVISLLLPLVCCGQDNDSTVNKRLFEITKECANQGDAGAQGSLGTYYYKGEGVAEDEQQAVYWIRKAAEQGHEKAKGVLKQFENK